MPLGGIETHEKSRNHPQGDDQQHKVGEEDKLWYLEYSLVEEHDGDLGQAVGEVAQDQIGEYDLRRRES